MMKGYTSNFLFGGDHGGGRSNSNLLGSRLGHNTSVILMIIWISGLHVLGKNFKSWNKM